ncbi:MAG: lipoyl(octanoyl) transferase LipB [Armatimonadota bacterium]|nr:lipoyl(octanoyl) transferase LipB [Armatimonadota bacterium]MDR7470935.1 lipoyl(octanoyl) transferase LipB [Armatimonadota bacterium]MDR7538451.1 lipoyl(octanoyl) transferase LipB [Armatimonadota bacterium]
MRDAWLVTLEGLTPFADAWALQRRLVAARQRAAIPDVVLLLQHHPVITLGRSGDRGHLLLPPEVLRQRGVEIYQIERGGGVTYHGPGQLVAYPILDLRAMDEDVVRFMRALEESVIRTVADFGINAVRMRGFPGVWVGEAKLAAVGVAVKRRVTMHGVALNVTTDLEPFTWINPCGLNRPVTSMSRLLGQEVSVAAVADAYARRFAEVYALELLPVGRPEVEERLAPLAAETVCS